jgi:hypothetical protein
MCNACAGAAEPAGAASGGDPVAFALGMTGCNKRELPFFIFLFLLACDIA